MTATATHGSPAPRQKQSAIVVCIQVYILLIHAQGLVHLSYHQSQDCFPSSLVKLQNNRHARDSGSRKHIYVGVDVCICDSASRTRAIFAVARDPSMDATLDACRARNHVRLCDIHPLLRSR